MSEGAITCKSGNEEKIAVHSAWIDGVKKNTLLLLVLGAIIVGFIVYLNARITSIEIKNAVEIATIKTEIEIKISSLEKQVESLKADCEQAKKRLHRGKVIYLEIRKEIACYRNSCVTVA